MRADDDDADADDEPHRTWCVEPSTRLEKYARFGAKTNGMLTNMQAVPRRYCHSGMSQRKTHKQKVAARR